jgi:hypothetical protein
MVPSVDLPGELAEAQGKMNGIYREYLSLQPSHPPKPSVNNLDS